EPIDLDRFVEIMRDALPGNPDGVPIEENIGGKLLSGQRLKVEDDASSSLQMYCDIFALNLGKDGTMFLVFRNITDADGIATEESRQTQALVVETIKYGE